MVELLAVAMAVVSVVDSVVEMVASLVGQLAEHSVAWKAVSKVALSAGGNKKGEEVL